MQKDIWSFGNAASRDLQKRRAANWKPSELQTGNVQSCKLESFRGAKLQTGTLQTGKQQSSREMRRPVILESCKHQIGKDGTSKLPETGTCKPHYGKAAKFRVAMPHTSIPQTAFLASGQTADRQCSKVAGRTPAMQRPEASKHAKRNAADVRNCKGECCRCTDQHTESWHATSCTPANRSTATCQAANRNPANHNTATLQNSQRSELQRGMLQTCKLGTGRAANWKPRGCKEESAEPQPVRAAKRNAADPQTGNRGDAKRHPQSRKRSELQRGMMQTRKLGTDRAANWKPQGCKGESAEPQSANQQNCKEECCRPANYKPHNADGQTAEQRTSEPPTGSPQSCRQECCKYVTKNCTKPQVGKAANRRSRY